MPTVLGSCAFAIGLLGVFGFVLLAMVLAIIGERYDRQREYEGARFDAYLDYLCGPASVRSRND